MSDREILERASVILRQYDFLSLSNSVLRVSQDWAFEDPPQPEGREVRIAAVLDRNGWVWTHTCREGTSDADTMEAAAMNTDDTIISDAFVTFRMPLRIVVPVVEGRAEA